MAKENKITIQFGDNTFAEFVEAKSPKMNQLREEVIPVCMKPLPRLIREKSIEDEELKGEEGYGEDEKKPKGSVWREYPKHWVRWIRYNWLFIWCDFDGKDTDFTRMMEGLGDEITSLKKEREADKDALADRDDDIWKLLAQKKDYEIKLKEIDDIRRIKPPEESETESEKKK